MRSVTRWVLVVIVAAHGLIHLMGVVKGFGWAEVGQLTQPIGTVGAVGWLVAAVVVLAAAGMLAVGSRAWWLAAALAAVVSQAVIVTSWTDAKAGTAFNVVMLLAAGYGYAAHGPGSFDAEYRRRTRAALTEQSPPAVVTEADLAVLPAPVADWVRRSGAVGQPHVNSFRATVHGRIRGGPTKAWMPFVGEQVNTFSPHPVRVFHIRASMAGLPVDVLHVFADGAATMRVKVCSLVPIVNAAGPDMDRAETVTLFNDLCVLAPAALLDAPVTWQVLDEHHIRASFTHGQHTVSAMIVLGDDHDLVDFISDDRLRAAPDGRSFTRQRWSTPIHAHRDVGPWRAGTHGEARWHAPDPEGEFAYLDFHLDVITYNTGARPPARTGRPVTT